MGDEMTIGLPCWRLPRRTADSFVRRQAGDVLCADPAHWEIIGVFMAAHMEGVGQCADVASGPGAR